MSAPVREWTGPWHLVRVESIAGWRVQWVREFYDRDDECRANDCCKLTETFFGPTVRESVIEADTIPRVWVRGCSCCWPPRHHVDAA